VLDGDTQQPSAASAASSTSSEFIIYSGKQGGGATVLGWGMTLQLLVTGGTGNCYFLNINILGKAAMLHFALIPFCGWGCASSACRLLGIAVLMLNSHRLLIICST
jgi:hypothetical protein